MSSDFETLKKKIIKRHLDQLKPHDLVAGPLESLPIFSTYDDLVTWTNDSQTQINQGKANREDVSTVISAVNLYRTGNDENGAITLMENSTKQISDLRHPDGHSTMVGPFCGAFFPKDYKTSTTPYLGIAYKGTNLTSREVLNDLWAAITTRASGYVWNSQVAQGFYYPLISTYYKTASLVPYAMVRTAIHDIVNDATNNVIIHVTGHSLGGAYATLTYAQLSIDSTGVTRGILGDLYTFGAPRVGRGDFAKPFKAAVAADTTEYYQALTYATTNGSPAHLPVAWGTLPLPQTTLSSSDVENKAFWNYMTNADSFTLQNRGDYIVGHIQKGSLIGEITAQGKLEASLVNSTIFNFDSTKSLFTGENQCVFVKEAKAQLGIYFIVAGTVVGYASVTTKDNAAHGVSSGTLTRGQCIWNFEETANLLEIQDAIAKDFDRVFTIT
ncbi:hypothetical protein Clacol_006943 [Clathrus columnatus]|uniref:Fungal lipase-type domain-containing protein n=1 Tax=Clathrus columnatus TaxID=1419009 RepID=A0AAV5AJ64_9AGAM|nr:hypothetical protein Clacol_006943 [Clathrus columnatus]